MQPSRRLSRASKVATRARSLATRAHPKLVSRLGRTNKLDEEAAIGVCVNVNRLLLDARGLQRSRARLLIAARLGAGCWAHVHLPPGTCARLCRSDEERGKVSPLRACSQQTNFACRCRFKPFSSFCSRSPSLKIEHDCPGAAQTSAKSLPSSKSEMDASQLM